ncbi:hypothetical protein BWI96_02685 [Siphonobacter sp. SORGH_AS_0500]|nr:hypothetical protein BWI96_02685 [Siphonobacter sp. SORGH_AS_0500]
MAINLKNKKQDAETFTDEESASQAKPLLSGDSLRYKLTLPSVISNEVRDLLKAWDGFKERLINSQRESVIQYYYKVLMF